MRKHPIANQRKSKRNQSAGFFFKATKKSTAEEGTRGLRVRGKGGRKAALAPSSISERSNACRSLSTEAAAEGGMGYWPEACVGTCPG